MVYDVIVVGSGISGLFLALNIKETLNVLLISKSTLGSGSSELAQGGIVSCIDKKTHYKDTFVAGNYYNNKDAVNVLQNSSNEVIEKLIDIGVNFDRDNLGNLLYTREGGHSKARILHHKDITGKEIIRALKERVLNKKNIAIKENEFVVDILMENTIEGITTLNQDKNISYYYSNNVILCTGGVGQVYSNTTNPLDITADGIAMAIRAGAKVKDMEFIQFHPTALYSNNEENSFLITEALRGEGAILRNINGERFMKNYHSMKELAPRDIVSRSIISETIKTKSEYVYLDITHRDSDFVRNRFPNICERCLKEGIDITKDYIKVYPVEHYLIGGIETDLSGRTSIKGLYACGECARTGVHGANRLASNSLLEAIVFAEKISREINNITSFKKIMPITNKKTYIENKDFKIDLRIIRKSLKDILNKYVFVIRTTDGLNIALDSVNQIKSILEKYTNLSVEYFEVLNMATVSETIIKSAIKRKESLGVHYRVN